MKLLEKFNNFKIFLERNKINYKKYIIIVFFASIISSIFELILPYIAKLEIDQLQYKTFSFKNLNAFEIFAFIVLLYFFINLIKLYLSSIFNDISNKYYEEISLKIVEIVIDRINNSEYGKFFDNKLKWILENLTNNLEQILNKIVNFFSKLLSSILFLAGISYIYFQVNIYIIPIIFLWVIIQYYLENYLEFLKRNWNIKSLDKNIDLSWAKRMMFRYPIEIITNGLTSYLKNKIHKLWTYFLNEEYKLNILKTKYYTISINIWTLIEAFIKISVWYTIFYHWASIWTLTMTIIFMDKLSEIFKLILNLKREFLNINYNLDLYLLFLEFTKNKHIWHIKNIKVNQICIKNLSFAYPISSELKNKFYQIENLYTKKLAWKNINYISEKNIKNPNILENINIVFKKWKIYWIIWKNWAWKTTLINLMLKAFNTKHIFYNNIKILDIHRDFFVNNVGIITQIPIIIPYTIRENITLWKNISDEKIYKYLEIFDLRKKIENLPKKLDSKIWEDVELSGWEKQIIAIIRILIQNYQILILDEWSNQLDVEKENKLINLLHQQKKDKIIIFISHRMTVINKTDFIYCLDNKTITDYWTPKELLERDSLFKKFYELEINRT